MRLQRQDVVHNKGYTLIELLVVVALIALFVTFALPRLTSYFQESIKSVTLDIATIVKEAYDASLLTGRVHRIAWDLENQLFWVESGPGVVLLDTEETRKKEEERKRFSFNSDSEAKEPPAFKLEESITKKKRPLPDGVKYEDITTEQSKSPQTTGVAYTHFFPHGLTEQTIVHLKDLNEHQTSLVISALIGKSEIKNEYVKQSP